MDWPSAFFGTTRNSRERGGMLSGSRDASSVASSSVAEREGPSRLAQQPCHETHSQTSCGSALALKHVVC